MAFGAIGFYRGRNHIGFKEVLPEGSKHAVLDLDRADAASVVATMAIDARRASKVCDTVPAVSHDHAGAAAATHQEPGKEMLRAPMVDGIGLAALAAAGLSRLECLQAHDRKLWNLLAEPLVLRVCPCLPAASRRVFHEALPVIGDAADIEGVVQEAVAPFRGTKQRGHVPLAPTGTRHSFGVEAFHDFHWRPTADILAVDAAHDHGLSLVDYPSPAVITVAYYVISVASAPGNTSGFDAAHLSALGLLRQIVKEHASQQALYGDEHLVHVAVRQRDDAHAPIGKLLMQSGAVR